MSCSVGVKPSSAGRIHHTTVLLFFLWNAEKDARVGKLDDRVRVLLAFPHISKLYDRACSPRMYTSTRTGFIATTAADILSTIPWDEHDPTPAHSSFSCR